MLLMEFSVVPLDKGASLSQYVASILDIVDKSGLDYRLTSMGTVVEGEWDALSNLLSACFQFIQTLSDRVTISVKYDYRKGRRGRLESKIDSVEKHLGRKLKTS